jgi:hypothetical protein
MGAIISLPLITVWLQVVSCRPPTNSIANQPLFVVLRNLRPSIQEVTSKLALG